MRSDTTLITVICCLDPIFYRANSKFLLIRVLRTVVHTTIYYTIMQTSYAKCRAENHKSDVATITILPHYYIFSVRRSTNNNEAHKSIAGKSDLFPRYARAETGSLLRNAFSSTWITNVRLRARSLYCDRSRSTCYYVITFVI